MDVGLFVEFPCRDGMSEQEAFAECFTLVEEAEASGVDSVWLAEYHFAPISVLSSPLMVASAIAARTRRIRIGLAVTLLPLYHPIHVAEDVAIRHTGILGIVTRQYASGCTARIVGVCTRMNRPERDHRNGTPRPG